MGKITKRVPWNKGLTKETSPVIEKGAEKRRGKSSWNKGLTIKTDSRIRPSGKPVEFYLKKFNLTKERLEDLYSKQQLSLPDLQKLIGIDIGRCYNLLEHFSIPIRSISESKATKRYKKKFRKTLLTKYGATSISSIPAVKEKKRQTFLKHYGEDNIFKTDSFKTEIKKRLPAIRRRQWAVMKPEEKTRRVNAMVKNLHSIPSSMNNNLELALAELLKILSIKYLRRFRISRYWVDFYLEKFNLIIETYGDYWHASPLKYKPQDKIIYTDGETVTAQSIWDRDNTRIMNLKSLGYTVLIFWETEVHESPEMTLATIDAVIREMS